MDDDGYRRSSLGKKRSSFCGIVKREALTGFAFVWWEREREEASFFFPWPGEKEGKSGFRFCAGAGLGRRLAFAGLDAAVQGRVASTVIQHIHRLEQRAAGSGRQLIRPSINDSVNLGRVSVRPAHQSLSAICPSLHDTDAREISIPNAIPRATRMYVQAPHVNPQTKTQHTRIKSHPCNLHSGDEWNAPSQGPPQENARVQALKRPASGPLLAELSFPSRAGPGSIQVQPGQVSCREEKKKKEIRNKIEKTKLGSWNLRIDGRFDFYDSCPVTMTRTSKQASGA
ncbi:hypothetical protein V8C43DRAFT_77962 [Trichoderma afarasin]